MTGIVTLALVVVTYGVVMLLGITRSSQLNETTRRADQIDAEIKGDKKLSQTLEQYNALAAINENFASILATRSLFLPNWEVVKTTVPQDVQFTSLSVQNDQTYSVSGEGKSVSSVANFTKALGTNSSISDIVPSALNKKSDEDKFVFSVNFTMSKIQQGAE